MATLDRQANPPAFDDEPVSLVRERPPVRNRAAAPIYQPLSSEPLRAKTTLDRGQTANDAAEPWKIRGAPFSRSLPAVPASIAKHPSGQRRKITALKWGGVTYLDDDSRRLRRCQACGILERPDGLNNPCPGAPT